MRTSVRAIVMTEFGAPEVLVEREVDEPVVGPDQALIDVELVNVTFVETQLRSGHAPHPLMLPPLPTIPGNGVGGVVAAVGADVGRELVGTRVVTSTGGSGAYAERVAAAVDGLISVPDPVTMPDAVALLADGRTAMALIAGARIKAGETVLVEAAGGGVGSLLVQLARAAGAHVLAVAGAEPKLRLARELGAVAAIDYTRESWTSQVVDALSDHAAVADIRCIDVVFDGVGGEIGRAAFELLRSGGRHCMFGMASGSFAPIEESDAVARGVTVIRGARLSPQDMTRLTKAALDLAAAGNLRPVIGQTLPLGRAADAHRAIEARSTLAKTLLLIRGALGDPPL